ncbi:DNA-processing protein DprA [candidate division KSB1 bacterium]|nr:DNA-processing protein DprA [candidate division KSB1 bacterium]
MQESLQGLLSVYLVEGIGSIRLRALMAKFGQVQAIFHADEQTLMSIDGIDLKLARRIKEAQNSTLAQEQLKQAEKHGAKILTFWDKDYPKNLKKIYDPPAFLFIKGEFKPEDEFAVAIVGTRGPSSYGKFCTERLSQDLVQKGFVVVSGLARGIDTLAHQTALRAGGRTIAVLGSGVDIIYPAENHKLYNQISENGAVVSEFLFGTKPDAPNFPRRNRIVSGLSLGVLVVEAGLKSGALITANYSLEHNRDVFSVPGNITSPKSIGCNRLIMEGAKLVLGVDDIINELEPQLDHLARQNRIQRAQITLSSEEKKLLDSLTAEPIHIDSIAAENNISISQALGILLSLELKEMVKQVPGKYFIRY